MNPHTDICPKLVDELRIFKKCSPSLTKSKNNKYKYLHVFQKKKINPHVLNNPRV